MNQRTYLKSLMLLTLFVGGFLSIPAVNAAKPIIHGPMPPIEFDDDIAFPNYLPIPPTLAGNGPMLKIGQMITFERDVVGFGKSVFTSVEEGVLNIMTGEGTTHGRITVRLGDGTQVSAESNGKIHATMLVVNGLPIPVMMSFDGHIESIGKGNAMHLNGEYTGSFLLYPTELPSGHMHMTLTFNAIM